jgi:ribosomal protein S18 acetylase RimI-like enzyme
MGFWKQLFGGVEESETFEAVDCREEDIDIRPYSSGDTKAVFGLWRDHFFVEVHRRRPNGQDVEIVSRHLDGREPSTIWVANCHGKTVGFLALTPPETNDGDAPIHVIAVHRAFRRNGVASRLFQTAVETLKQNSATSWISVSDMSTGSHISNMAEQAGFQWLRNTTYVLSIHGDYYPW